MNVTIPTADAGKDDSRNTKLPAAEEMNTSALEGGAEILKTEKECGSCTCCGRYNSCRGLQLRAVKRTGAVQKNSRAKMLELGGFIIGENGLIERCENPSLVVEDGIIILPSDDRCKGDQSRSIHWNYGSGRNLYSGQYYMD
mgnify:CR=1 FL=1